MYLMEVVAVILMDTASWSAQPAMQEMWQLSGIHFSQLCRRCGSYQVSTVMQKMWQLSGIHYSQLCRRCGSYQVSTVMQEM
jgi:hypothetical protein